MATGPKRCSSSDRLAASAGTASRLSDAYFQHALTVFEQLLTPFTPCWVKVIVQPQAVSAWLWFADGAADTVKAVLVRVGDAKVKNPARSLLHSRAGKAMLLPLLS